MKQTAVGPQFMIPLRDHWGIILERYLCPTDGTIIINTPAFAVSEGDEVVLSCQYSEGNHTTTTFFKDGAEIISPRSFSSDRGAQMKIENVTKADEGFYKCVSQDGQMQSPESWLSVRGQV